MNISSRSMGIGMATLCVLTLLVAQPRQTVASECWQTCEAKQAACAIACEQAHLGYPEAMGLCYDTCDQNSARCFEHATWCTPSPNTCFTCIVSGCVNGVVPGPCNPDEIACWNYSNDPRCYN